MISTSEEPIEFTTDVDPDAFEAHCGGVYEAWFTNDLKAHPLNEQIYHSGLGLVPKGPDNLLVDGDRYKSIERFGILEPIVINFDGVIISGHSRWLIAKALGLESVPVRLIDATGLEGEQLLIEANRQRVKTQGHIAREVEALVRIEKELAEGRMKAGIAADAATAKAAKTAARRSTSDPSPSQDLGSKGKAVDIVAAKVSQSKNTVEKEVKIVQEAAKGNPVAVAGLADLDRNKSSVAAVHRAITEAADDQLAADLDNATPEPNQQPAPPKDPSNSANATRDAKKKAQDDDCWEVAYGLNVTVTPLKGKLLHVVMRINEDQLDWLVQAIEQKGMYDADLYEEDGSLREENEDERGWREIFPEAAKKIYCPCQSSKVFEQNLKKAAKAAKVVENLKPKT